VLDCFFLWTSAFETWDDDLILGTGGGMSSLDVMKQN
jgi:hypothetical protein